MSDQPARLARLLPWSRYVVDGDSMLPSLRPRDCVVVAHRARIAAGDIVVARRPNVEGLLLVKRAARQADGGWWLLSDNADAGIDDSRAFGVLPEALIVGRVVARYYPAPRRFRGF